MRPLHDGSGTDGKVQLATWAAIVTHRAEFVDRPYDAARRAGGFTVPALLLHVLTGCIWGRKLPAEFIGADGGLAHGPILVTGVSRDKYIVPNPNGVNNSSFDEPDYSGGPLHLNHNPRKVGNNYFDATVFSMNALGTAGNAKRRFFHGPGGDNYDIAVAKSLPLAESKTLLFRVESFNIFNHTQFNGPGSVDGNIGSSTFGNAISAAPPRILQGALKFSF